MSEFADVQLSLEELLGKEYTGALAAFAAASGRISRDGAERMVSEKISFLPRRSARRDMKLLQAVGTQVLPPLTSSPDGAPTDPFRAATHKYAAPIGGMGNFRVGEDGRLYYIGKSEHYHASLGHSFNGYRLVDYARFLGVPNATHNNTRGFITRTLENRLIAALNPGRDIAEVLADRSPRTLNRIINLETGSLATEAAVKMMLSRFYRMEARAGEPKYAGKTPVFFVMGDLKGGLEANYHGTSVITQTFRGLWPEMYERLEAAGIYKVVGVRINDTDDFREKLRVYNSGSFKTAGFIHEIVLMNYGAIRLSDDYLREVYALCHASDTPVLCDEIQSCMWYKGMFLHRVCGLDPDFVAIGKGFSGGEYPASKLALTAEMDTLPLFGALVTNGQEELASLSYLVTMAFCEANGDVITENGEYFFDSLCELALGHTATVTMIEGDGHLAAIHFARTDTAVRFCRILNDGGIDTAIHTYKPYCPPAVLFKPPLTAGRNNMDFIVKRVEDAIKEIEK